MYTNLNIIKKILFWKLEKNIYFSKNLNTKFLSTIFKILIKSQRRVFI